MNRRRLGQLLIGGVFTLFAGVMAALIELAEKEEAKRAEEKPTGAQGASGKGE